MRLKFSEFPLFSLFFYRRFLARRTLVRLSLVSRRFLLQIKRALSSFKAKRPCIFRARTLFYISNENYLWILPEPSPPASFSTSARVTML